MQFWRQRSAIITATILTVGSPAVAQVVHDARGFDCGFLYEKTKGGKSGEATCSYTGEQVFATGHPAGEHCYTQNVFQFEDIKLRVDLASSNVTWEREKGLAPFAVTQMIEHYMRT